MPTSYDITRAENEERWWYDVDSRTVRDENGLTVAELRPSAPHAEGETIAAAPHALSLVSRLSRLLGAVASGEVGPEWKVRARDLIGEASNLIADPGSSACIAARRGE